MLGFVSLIPDTVQGTVILSVFDFFACFFVLYFIGLIIKGLGFIVSKGEQPNKEA